MKRRRLELADVFREHATDYFELYRGITSPEDERVLRAVANCRTAALGGHKLKCDRCGHEEISYNSCRNRHCPKCQGAARKEWLAQRAGDLLPGVEYFHVVFTIPDKLGPVTLQNKRYLYDLLFRAVSETLQTIARDPKHLGAAIGFLAVLHSWGQNLHLHPHLHCVVPGGGISPDAKRWIPCRKGFFLPVRVLGRLFRKKFLAFLRHAFAKDELKLSGTLDPLKERENWRRFLRDLDSHEWVVYAKPPFGDAEQVLKYLARYTHRVAISNNRLVSLEDRKVTFRWKDYKHQRRKRTMTLEATEFIRRFLQHVLPKGFQRIRMYGFLANRSRQKKLALCRELLGSSAETEESDRAATEEPVEEEKPTSKCPHCDSGRLVCVGEVEPVAVDTWDTS